MAIELSEREQAVLNAACVKVEKATQEAQALQRAAEEAARRAEIAGHEARGVYRSLMELGGKNPDAHLVNWDGTTATVAEVPKMESPVKPEAPKEPEADNVVALPSVEAAHGSDETAE